MKNAELHGFRIYREESLSETCSRVILEQFNQSLGLCDWYFEDPDAATHEIRKSIKRIRAVYRLYRNALGIDRCRNAQDHYGKISHMLAEHRLSAAYIETLGQLVNDKKLPVKTDFINKLVVRLENNHKKLTHTLINKQGIHLQLKNMLISESNSLLAAQSLACDFSLVSKGLCKTYKQGRQDLDRVIQQPHSENLHDLRKRVKSLWNQMILLRPVWPSTITLTVHQLDLLATKLGYEHDLAELDHYLTTERSGKDREQLLILSDFMMKKRQTIQRALMPLALRLFAERPKPMMDRMEGYYRLFLKK